MTMPVTQKLMDSIEQHIKDLQEESDLLRAQMAELEELPKTTAEQRQEINTLYNTIRQHNRSVALILTLQQRLVALQSKALFQIKGLDQMFDDENVPAPRE